MPNSCFLAMVKTVDRLSKGIAKYHDRLKSPVESTPSSGSVEVLTMEDELEVSLCG